MHERLVYFKFKFCFKSKHVIIKELNKYVWPQSSQVRESVSHSVKCVPNETTTKNLKRRRAEEQKKPQRLSKILTKIIGIIYTILKY